MQNSVDNLDVLRLSERCFVDGSSTEKIEDVGSFNEDGIMVFSEKVSSIIAFFVFIDCYFRIKKAPSFVGGGFFSIREQFPVDYAVGFAKASTGLASAVAVVAWSFSALSVANCRPKERAAKIQEKMIRNKMPAT